MRSLVHIFFAAGIIFVMTACGGEEAPADKAPADPAAAADKAAPEAPAAAPADARWCQPEKCSCMEGKEIVEGKAEFQHCNLTADATIQGVKVKGGEHSMTLFNKEGMLTGFDLAEPHTFGDIECKGASVRLIAPDKVRSCYMTKPHEVAGIKCDGNLSMNEDGTVHRCKLSEAMKFENFEATAGTWITFYDGTKLVDRFEVGDNAQEVDGHKCKGYMNYLHKNGKVRKCKLEAEEKIEGKKYEAGTDVCFDEAGKVVECSTMKFTTV